MYFQNNVNPQTGVYGNVNQIPLQQQPQQSMYMNSMMMPNNPLAMQQMPYSNQAQQQPYGVNTNNALFPLGQMSIQPYMDR